MAILLGRLRREHGHVCRLVGTSAAPARFAAYGIRIQGLRDLEELRDTVVRFAPDVILSALDASVPAAALAALYGIPHVVAVHSFEWTPPTARERRAWQVSEDREYIAEPLRREVMRSASAVLANSRYMQRRLRRARVSSVVVTPAFEPADFLVRAGDHARREFVTAVAGYGYKGAGIVLALAAAMPSVRFQLVGRVVEPWRRRAAALSNVAVVPHMAAREFLAGSRVVLVPSQWPEPFGRVAVEAIANGIPTIVSETGGLVECARGAVFVRRFRSAIAWQHALDAVLNEPGDLRNEDAGHVAAFDWRRASRVGTTIADRVLRRVVRKCRPPRRRPIAILAGAADARTAFSLINQRWLARRGEVDLIARSDAGADAAHADIHVRHDFSRDFPAWAPPPSGHLIAVRTWDFGPYPPEWVRVLVRDYDQLWVGTRWIAKQAVDSGVPANRVKVVPLGVDLRAFSPQGPRYPLPGPRRFTFLFVGAPIPRKGVDILIRAYLAGFRRQDAVRLVIKANPDDLFYVGADLRESLAGAMREPDAPQIVFVDRFLSVAELAALYRAADVSVFPYRAEGFCLPILESMACGRPVIVPKFGAALDFCSERTSFFTPARRISVPVPRRFAINTLGFEEDIDAVDFCEVDVAGLAARMRDIAARPAEALRRTGARARAVARAFTWEASRAAADRAMLDALRHPVPVRFVRMREEAERHAHVLATASRLYLGGVS